MAGRSSVGNKLSVSEQGKETLQHLLIPSMLPMTKRCIGGQICLFLLAKLERLVSELARMYKAFVSSSAMESIAMKVTVVLPILLLQKPSARSKAKDHSARLQRRMIA